MPGASLPFKKTRTALVLRAREIRAYLADRKGQAASAGKKNILIYGQGRSGTTLFESLMCSTGYFSGHHEVLNTVTREVLWPTAYVRGLGRQIPGENVIAHVKPEHLTWERKAPIDPQPFLRALHEDGWTLVHIQRHNVLRQMVSKRLALARGGFHKHGDGNEAIRLTLEPEEFAEDYARRISWLDREDQLLVDLPHIKLSYENDFARPEAHQGAVDTVLDALGLEARPVSTQLRKVNTFAPYELLSNAVQLRSVFEARGWEWTL